VEDERTLNRDGVDVRFKLRSRPHRLRCDMSHSVSHDKKIKKLYYFERYSKKVSDP
jgi:hypothetical protein